MPYDTPNSNRGRSSSRQRARVSVPSQGAYHGPMGTQQRATARGGRPSRGRGGIGRGNPQMGYPLRARNINFQGARNRRGRSWRPYILAALAIVLAVLLVVGVSSCVRGCSSPSAEQPQGEQNQVDSRVAAGVNDDLTKRFSAALDRDEKLARIAANANKYDDQALLDLALDEPEAIDFVAGYPDSSKSAQAVTDSVTKGSAPTFYDWDARWGAVDYGEHALAVSGSGPTALSMAYMGLTGSADKSPADIASLAQSKGAATGESGTSSSYFEAAADELGLTVKTHQSSADSITTVLDAGTYLLLEVKAGTLTDGDAHWVLAVTENSDNTVTVHDPTSPAATARPWSPATLANACDSFISVTLKADDSSDSAQ